MRYSREIDVAAVLTHSDALFATAADFANYLIQQGLEIHQMLADGVRVRPVGQSSWLATSNNRDLAMHYDLDTEEPENDVQPGTVEN